MIRYKLFGIIFFAICAFPVLSTAQNKSAPWTLQQCIDYALKNNIQIRQSELTKEINQENLTQYKANVLPTLNGNASHSYNFGRTIDPFTNQFATNMVLSQNFSLSTSLVVFNGLQKLNTIHQGQYDLLASREDLDKMKNDVTLNIASAYLQILFNEELLAIARNQIDITQLQVERTKKLVDAGTSAKGNLLQMQAQAATDELTLANAKNQLDLSYLNLAQLLYLDNTDNFSIEKPELSMPAETILTSNPSQIFASAVAIQPAIKSAQYKLKSYEMALKVARGGVSPRLAINASLGTGYSGASKQFIGTPNITGFTPNGNVTASGELVYQPTYYSPSQVIPFQDQVSNNYNRSIGFYLTVPIFNGLQTHATIERAKLSHKNADLNLELQKVQLRKTIQQAYADANASLVKYAATKKAVESSQESFKYTDQKFNVGMLNSIDYNDAKNKLIKAQSDLLQAKFDYIFKMKVLDFYQGKPLTL